MVSFEDQKDLKRDFSHSEMVILIKIINLPQKKSITRAQMARAIKVSNYESRFSNIIKYLKKIKVIEEVEEIGNNHLLRINEDLLKHFIDEQNILNFIVDNYIKKYHGPFIW